MVSSVSTSYTSAVVLPNQTPQALNAADISNSARTYLASRDSNTTTGAPKAGTDHDPAVVMSLSGQAQQILDEMSASFAQRKQELADAENTQGPFAGVTIELSMSRKGSALKKSGCGVSFACRQFRKSLLRATKLLITAS